MGPPASRYDNALRRIAMWLAARWGGALTPLLVVFVLDVVNWRESFYIFGAIGFFWAFFFFRWFRDRPEQHPGVNAAELLRLANPERRADSGHGDGGAPWKKFFTNRSVWLLCLQYACLSYGFWFYLTWLPTYIKEEFGMKEADRYLAGALAGLPLFLAGVSVYLTGKVTPCTNSARNHRRARAARISRRRMSGPGRRIRAIRGFDVAIAGDRRKSGWTA